MYKRQVLESARLAKLKNLVILDGFCWRYDKANEEAHRKLSSGEMCIRDSLRTVIVTADIHRDLGSELRLAANPLP